MLSMETEKREICRLGFSWAKDCAERACEDHREIIPSTDLDYLQRVIESRWGAVFYDFTGLERQGHAKEFMFPQLIFHEDPSA